MYYVDIHSNIYIIHNGAMHIQWYKNCTFVKQTIDISFEVEPKYICCSKQYVIIANDFNIFIYNISTKKSIKESIEFQIKQINIVGSELYITAQHKLIKYNIPSLFNEKNITSIIDFSEDCIYAQYGRYYNYIECGETAYVCGTNYFKHFGGLQELHYQSWTPIQSSMLFSDKTAVEVCNNSIKIYGTVPHIIELARTPMKNNISLIDNSIAFIISSDTETQYELHIYKMDNSAWNSIVYSLDVEIFFQGIDWIRLNTSGVLIKLLNNTVLFYCPVQQTCIPVLHLPAQPVSCHAAQPVCLSASNHSAFHTVWNNSQIQHIGRSCHSIIQNHHEITSIQMNNYYTLYLFRNNTCISITNTGELDIELFPSNIIAIACGNEHYIALCSNGTVWIRGDNSYGQLGINRYSTFEDWIQLTDKEFIDNAQDILAAISLNKTVTKLSPDSRHIIKISTGVDTSFFIAKDYSIYACGCNTAGQLGIGTQFNRKQQTRLNRFAGILTKDRIDSIAGGSNFTVFLTQAGDVYIAGFSQHLFPHKIASNIVQIAVGLEHYILLDKTGTATTNTGATIENCIQIIAGAQHSIFITANGILAAGQNSYNQCGNFQYISPYPSINTLKN